MRRAAVSTAVLAGVLAAGAAVWWVVGGDGAGWIITLMATLGVAIVDALVEGEERYLRASPRVRHSVLAGTFVLAVIGSASYVVWPGTLGWYLIGAFAMPLVWVLAWGRTADRGTPNQNDGPWTAP